MPHKFYKLHDILLKKILTLFIAIFLIIGGILYFWIKDIYIEQIKIDLLHNIDIVSLQIKNLQSANEIAKKVKNRTNQRVTIISKNGTVLGESDHKFTDMDNHLKRAEIKQALNQEYGSIIRHSITVNRELLYVSKKFSVNNKEYFIRMASDTNTINQKFLYLSLKIGFLFLLFMAFSFWIALKISKDVQNETQQILTFLKNLTTQKEAKKIESIYSVEFNKITKILTSVSENLSKKNKQKSKYTTKLKLSNRQKDDIIAAISHEFKNPIAVISGYVQTLQEDTEINPKIREKFLSKIASNALKLTNMIDRLRLSIRLEQGQHAYNFLNYNLNTIIKSCIEDIKCSYPNRNIIIDSVDVRKNVDETMIAIAIINIIENGLKYSQDDIYIVLNDKFLSVTDTGIGIDNSDLSKISDKFYRVSSNGWNNSLGVGLTLVKNIVDLHNFKLKINSTKDKGSTFKVIF